MKAHLTIGVRELVEFVLRSGDLKVEFAGASRAADAIRLHQKIQAVRPADYISEVTIAHQVETPDVVLAIGGRIDGVFQGAALPVIDEIKTTRRSPEECLREENPLHWGQAKVYAFLYAAQHELTDIGVQLTYARLDTGALREARRYFSRSELRLFFEDLVARYLQWATRIIHWQRRRDDAIRDLAFPFDGYRPGQREMVDAVFRTIQDSGRIFIQAATGIGKTMAVLFPAIRTLADRACTKIFYLTARTTARLAAEKALDELRAQGLRLKSLALTAREKACFNPDRACHPDECDFARGHYDRLPAARDALFMEDGWTRAAVAATARSHRVCPFEFALDLSLWADLIVCDYNYAFDPTAYLRHFFLEPTGDVAFLVDEAHNLVDRSRDMFSAELRKQPFLNLRRALQDALPTVHRCLGRINRWMLTARRNTEAAGAPTAERRAPQELDVLLRDFMAAAEKWLEKNLKSAFREELLERYFETGGFLRVLDQFDESYAACYDAVSSDLRLKLFCMDPSQQIGAALTRCRSAVFFSATLTPLDYFQTMLASASAETLLLPSPFPDENLAVFVADRLSTYYRHRDRTKSQVVGILHRLVEPQAGNYLLFFPSYQYMHLVRETFQTLRPDVDVVVQQPGMSEPQRESFLARFETDNPRTLVGFAVMGGIFGEGIDLVGTRLSGAAVVGVGLPAVCLERELIRGYFADRLEQGFEYAYLYPGINRVLQAAGRVIRSETDRGVVLLIDQRYGSEHYQALLPAGWRLQPIRDPDEFVDGLHRFWAGAPSGVRARSPHPASETSP
ncbi:MAG: ATP-dependent DNA helicase [Desulfobacterales bacterium]|jgi:DNA excision repair protein ERCC-2|nr:ATP-dependent DNA helicase [Desulfobacterales bacterium]